MSDDRLRRQLQAQAVVNRQLHAQLAEVTAELRAVQGADANTVRVLWHRIESVLPRTIASRVERRVRGALGAPVRSRPRWAAGRDVGSIGEWLDELQGAGFEKVELSLVEDTAGSTYLVEGTQKRPITKMLVGALLEVEMGPPRPVTDEELDELDEGPPVEVFVSPSEVPFVIVGGRRRPINGYPLPHNVEDDQAERFEEGEPLRVGRLRRTAGTHAGGSEHPSALRRIRARWPG
jgi:hypothetical protein